MRIVICGQYYWPENFLINDIAEELVARGHEVCVITGLPDYATGTVPKEYRRGRRRHEIRNGVEVFRVPVIARRSGFFFRVLNYLSFWITSSAFARIHPFDADVLMSYQTAPVFMGAACIVLKRLLGKPLFFYCIDLWPEQMKVWGVGEKNPAFKLVHKYCKHAYGAADIVGVSSPMFREYLREVNGVMDDRIVYLPQHAARLEVDEDVVRTDDGTVNLVFAGNIGRQQNLECLLRAVSMVTTDAHFHVHVYGDGVSFERCVRLARELGICDRVTFYGRVGSSDLSRAYADMDAFLLTLCSQNSIGYVANTIPAKLQGYMSAGKPIIASAGEGVRRIVEESGCGIAVPADDASALARAITEFVECPRHYAECGERARRYFNENYEKSVVIDQLEGYLHLLVHGQLEG